MKLQNPFGKGKELWISQTYHSNSSNIAVDFGHYGVDTPVYAMASGQVTITSSAYGSYLQQTVDGAVMKIFYVHIYRFVKKKGDRVNVGDLIGYIAPKSANGGYDPHLHGGLSLGFNLMDYMDRSIVFRTKYEDIRKIWFNGDNLNWSLFKDLHIGGGGFKIGDRIIFRQSVFIREGSGLKYKAQQKAVPNETTGTIKDGVRYSDGYEWWDIAIDGGGSGWCAWREGWYEKYIKPVIPPEPTPSDPPQGAVMCLECTKWEKRCKEACEKNEGLKIELGALEMKYQEGHRALKAEREKVKTLEVEKEELSNDLSIAREGKERAEKERLKLQEKHSDDYRNYTRWSWLIDMLNKIIPAKNDRKA